jgi:hypothetical protein
MQLSEHDFPHSGKALLATTLELISATRAMSLDLSLGNVAGVADGRIAAGTIVSAPAAATPTSAIGVVRAWAIARISVD